MLFRSEVSSFIMFYARSNNIVVITHYLA